MPPSGESSLRRLQLRLMHALLGGSLEDAAPLAAGPRSAVEGGLAIYRTNILGNFHDALASSFPAIRRLVGEDYFRQTAREFQRRHPSRSGDLAHVGKPFPQYLAELHAGGRFAYLADVAGLEWLIQDALLAPGHAPFDLTRLAAVPPADYDALRFALHPSLRLFTSPYPALRIWETNVGPDADAQTEPETLDLDSGGDALAISCRRLTLQVLRLEPGEAGFLAALQSGVAFADAIAAGGAAGEAFDATAALRRFVQADVIVDCR